MRYRDPECACTIEYPGGYRNVCDHCRTDGPLPGSLADPDWEQRQGDPDVLLEAADRLGDGDPLARQLRAEADRITEEVAT